jgi:hypothetical protein
MLSPKASACRHAMGRAPTISKMEHLLVAYLPAGMTKLLFGMTLLPASMRKRLFFTTERGPRGASYIFVLVCAAATAMMDEQDVAAKQRSDRCWKGVAHSS